MKRKRLLKFDFNWVLWRRQSSTSVSQWLLLAVFLANGVVLSEKLYAEQNACDGEVAEVIGVAVDVETGNQLYCEYHHKIDKQRWRVDYTISGDVFAVKTLDYSSGVIAPQITQIDNRTGELREVGSESDRWLVKYRSEKNAEVESKRILQQGSQVIDAGFDAFVRQQWEPLNAGKTVVFDFVSIPHLKTIALRARAVAMDECNVFDLRDEFEAPRCLSVEANSGLLRLFVDPLLLLYDDQQRLRGFKGAVNIQNGEQNTQDAIIYYRYKKERN